jgi:hypothetical protein
MMKAMMLSPEKYQRGCPKKARVQPLEKMPSDQGDQCQADGDQQETGVRLIR